MLKQFYSDKVICIVGYHTLLAKLTIKKLLLDLQCATKIYLLKIDKQTKHQDEFYNSNYYRLVDSHEKNNGKLKDLIHSRLAFITTQQLKLIPRVDILFNFFIPFDFSNLEKALQSHILKTHWLCKELSQVPILSCVQFSSVYAHSPGLLSQTEQHGNSIRFIPPKQKSKQALMSFVQDTFDSQLQAWQWSLKFLQQSFCKVIPLTSIIRVPIIGPAINAPLEGYSDKFNNLTYMLYQIGNGFITHMNGKRQNIIDIIPVDYIANYFIVVARDMLTQYALHKQPSFLRQKSSLKEAKQGCIIHNLSTSSRHPINLQKFLQFVCESWKEYQQRNISVKVQNQQWARKIKFAQEEMPQKVKYRIGRLMDIKSWKIDSQKDQITLNKKKQLIMKYQFFLEHQWICQSNKSIDVFANLSPEQQTVFACNVNAINWKNYARICVYGIKKYLLGQQVQHFSSNRMDLLTISKQSYFSDILWAISAGKTIETQKPQQIKNFILSTKSVNQAIRSLVEEQVLKLQRNPASYQKVQQQYTKVAQQICDQMFSQYQMKSIRMFGWILHKVFKAIYEKVVVDKNDVMKIRNYDQKANGPIIIIPTHRSYIDFLIMSYVFFGYGIKVPHIAAAEDFLNMAVVHILLRKSGAFFIKRNQQKYRVLYKAIMTQYISKLLSDCHYLQFFIQGTRSRVGKMLSPKYGILSIVAKNVMDGKIPDAQILPVTLNYQKILEGTSFTYELMGEPKVKQSLSRLIKAVDTLKQNFGRIYIEFCQPISVKKYFSQRATLKYDDVIQQLGYQIVHDLSDHLVVTAPAILATSILMYRKGISEDSLVQTTNWICKQLASRKIKIARSQSDSSISITNTLQMMKDVVTRSKKDMFQVQLSFDQNSFSKLFTMTYYRNTLTHIFFEQSIVATALTRFGHQNIIVDTVSFEQLYHQTKFLYSLLDQEYVLKYNLSQQNRFKHILDFMTQRNSIRNQNGKIVAVQPNGINFNFYCSLIWPLVQSYWITALYLFKLIKSQQVMPMQRFLSQIQWFAQSLITERIVLHIQAISLDTIKNAVAKYKMMKLISTINEKVQGNDVPFVKILASQPEIRKIQSKIKLFLKSSYAQSVTGILDSGSGSVNLDFPFLSKM